MTRIILIVIGLIVFKVGYVQSQITIDAGTVKADPKFLCGPHSAFDWHTSIAPLGAICDSKNQIEIRMLINMHHVGGDLILFSFDGNIWNARMYSSRHGRLGSKVNITDFGHFNNDRNFNSQIFTPVFDTLKANNIFALPDQNELVMDSAIYHRIFYQVVFKAGDKFREYRFNNVDQYLETNPEVKELRQYAAIVRCLYSIFD